MPPKIVTVKDPNSDQIRIRLVPQRSKKTKNGRRPRFSRAPRTTAGASSQSPAKQLTGGEVASGSETTLSTKNQDVLQLPSSSHEPANPLSDEMVNKWEKVLVQKMAEVQQLSEVEMTLEDLDSPDSAYMRISKSKQRLMPHVRKFFKISKEKYQLDRKLEKKIRLQDVSPFPMLNSEVERYVNTLPDILQQPTRDDIHKVVSAANEEADPKYANSEVELNQITTRFHESIVKIIKARRLEDFKIDLFLKDAVLPEDSDPELKAKFEAQARDCPSMEMIMVRERQENDPIDESEEIGGEDQESDDDNEYEIAESETDEDITDQPLTREVMDEDDDEDESNSRGTSDDIEDPNAEAEIDAEHEDIEECEVETDESEKENSENGLDNPCVDDSDEVECLEHNDEVEFVGKLVKTKCSGKLQTEDDGGADSDCQIID